MMSIQRLSHIVVMSSFLIASAAGQNLLLAEETWRSELYPTDWAAPSDRSFEDDKLIQDFSYAGYHRGERPIPERDHDVHDVTEYGADRGGREDSTEAIQQAIDAAAEAGGGVVYLPRGVYRVTVPEDASAVLRIRHSGVVLRGAGRDRTFIQNHTHEMRRKSVIQVRPEGGRDWRSARSEGAEAAIAEDLLTPTQQIPVEDVEGFSVGDWVVLRADATEPFIAEHGLTDYWGGYGSRLRGVMFYRQIVEIDAANDTLTIDVPIRYYLKTRDNARVYHTHEHLEEVGIEHLAIGNVQHPGAEGWDSPDFREEDAAAYDVHSSALVRLHRVRNSWLRQVYSFRPTQNGLNAHMLSNGLIISYSRGVTVEECRFQRPQYGGGGGNGYMIRLANANENLVRDSHVAYNRHGFVVSSMGSSGNVFHGGSARQTGWQAAGTGRTNGRANDHHMHLSQSTLVDSVTVERDWFEARYRRRSGTIPHAVTGAHCVFWNIRGEAYHRSVEHIVHSAQARYGYVIGTRGPAHGVNLNGPEITKPRDHVEGVGEGDRLEPASLYLDQLERRLGQ